MRTTVDIDEDVLSAAKELAEPDYRGGFRLLPRTGQVITPAIVDRWLEEGG